MDKVRLNKSIIMVHNILRILRVLTVISGVIIVVVGLAFISSWNLHETIINSPSYSVNTDVWQTTMLYELGDYVIPYAIGVCSSMIFVLVFEFLCLKKGIAVLGEMREGTIFAGHYGTEIRKICKLMIIRVVGEFVLATTLATQIISDTSITSNISVNRLVFVAFISLASYLLDYAYYHSQKISEGSDVTTSESE